MSILLTLAFGYGLECFSFVHFLAYLSLVLHFYIFLSVTFLLLSQKQVFLFVARLFFRCLLSDVSCWSFLFDFPSISAYFQENFKNVYRWTILTKSRLFEIVESDKDVLCKTCSILHGVIIYCDPGFTLYDLK